jgi:hypothetical protein
VVKHDYQTRNPRKYIGSPLESDNPNYRNKNQSSVVLWDCNYFPNRCLTPDFVSQCSGSYLHNFEWLAPHQVGELPVEWNWLVGEQQASPDAKLLHYTCGVPGFKHYADKDHAAEWYAVFRDTIRLDGETPASLAEQCEKFQ